MTSLQALLTMKSKSDSASYNPRKYLSMTNHSTLKLDQVATKCGSTISGIFLGQLLEDPRFTREQIAAILSTTPDYFEMVMAEPEPTIYDPMTNNNEGDIVNV